MSFDDQVNNRRHTGIRYSVFKEGVKTKWLTGQNGILFRILPAYNYADKDAQGNVNPAGWVQSRDQNGKLTSWGALITLHRYVGHGAGKSANRKDFVAPVTFTGDEKTFDPVGTLHTTAAMYPEWQYLVEDRREGNTDKGRIIERAAITRSSEALAINIVELGGVNMPECVLGLCTKSTTDGLVDREKNGLVHQRANNVSKELIAQNPMYQWAIGDITDPTNGPVLFIQKGNDRGEFSGYQVGLAVDNMNNVRHYPVGPELLVMRYDLARVTNIMDQQPVDEVVQELVELFCMRSPSGHHEHALLKLAFGDHFRIPEPPSAPAGMPTVQSGFAAPSTGFGPAPSTGFGPAPSTGFGPAPSTGFGPKPRVGFPQQQGQGSFQPGPAMQPQQQAPGAFHRGPVVAPPAAAQKSGSAPDDEPCDNEPDDAGAPEIKAPPTGAQKATGSGPIAPGDEVPRFSREAFLQRLGGSAHGTAPGPRVG